MQRTLRTAVVIVILFSIIIVTINSQVPPSCGSGVPNTNPIITNAPVLVNSTTYGKLYVVNQVNPPLWILHLSGTPYQMGYARGMLMKNMINEIVPQVYQWLESDIESILPDIPQPLRDWISEVGIDVALDAEILATEMYTPSYFIEEMHGIADGAGISYDSLYQMNMLPELIQAACSMFGAWGQAIANGPPGSTLFQLRALDWATNGPFQQYPVVFVYHPQPGAGHPYATLGWAGFVGALTGFSSAPLGVCEKVWISYNGTYNRFGIPFTFLLRDILQWDTDIDSALTRISNAERTCSIFVGLGQAQNSGPPNFVAVEYSYDRVNFLDQANFPVYTGHPKFNDLVYIDKHVQPSHNPCLGDLMQQYYGNITAENTVRYIASEAQTGDMHIGVFDFYGQAMYVSNASPYSKASGAQPAYSRSFVRVDLSSMFN